MDDIKTIAAKLAGARDQEKIDQANLDATKALIDKLRQQLAEAVCPFKIGDMVQREYENHAGEVVEIIPPRWMSWSRDTWALNVALLRKDGSVGRRIVTFDERDNPKKMEA